MFGYTIIRSEALDNLFVKIGGLTDVVNQRDRTIQQQDEEIAGLARELAEAKARIEKIKVEHDALVGLCYDESSPESKRANSFSATVSDVSYDAALAPPLSLGTSVPDATGHSS